MDEAILDKKLKDDKTTGWNNSVKECKSIKYLDRKFLLVEITSGN